MDQTIASRTTALRKKLADNLARVRENIASSVGKVDRDPDGVMLLAVTKSVDLDVIRVLLDLEQRQLGESRVQQLVQRASMLSEQLSRRTMLDQVASAAKPHWHMVGHLQRNKVKAALPVVELIHSLDTLRLAEEIHTQAGKLGKRQNVLLEVNCSGESQKYGMAVAAVGHFIEQTLELTNLRVCGLMTMAPQFDEPERTRPVFERLYELFLEAKLAYRLGKEFEHLSMGMSGDYRVAVECGATIVRVGTALFEGIEAQT